MASSPQGCTNLKLRQLARRVARLYDEDQRCLGLKGTQYSLLSYVVKLGPIRPGELAGQMGLDPSTLTRNLASLVSGGWVTIEPGVDARSRSVVATDAGHELRTQAQRAWKRSQLALNARLGDERVMRLHELLDECIALLDEPDAGGDADE